MRKVTVSQIGEEKDGQVRMAVAVQTKLFGTLRGRMALPVTRVGERVGVRWRPYLRLPGLRPGERVRRTIRAVPRRASVLAADGHPLDNEPTAAALAGQAAGGERPGLRPRARLQRPARRAPERGAAVRLRAGSPPPRRAAAARCAPPSGPACSAPRSPRSATGSAASPC